MTENNLIPPKIISKDRRLVGRPLLFIKENGKINNSDYRTLNDVSKATATRDLTELVEKFRVLNRSGEIGAGTTYVLIGHNWLNWLIRQNK